MIGSTLFPERALTEFERYHHNQKTFPYLPSRALLPPAALAGHDVFFLSATALLRRHAAGPHNTP